jgi:hypothetical protein
MPAACCLLTATLPVLVDLYHTSALVPWRLHNPPTYLAWMRPYNTFALWAALLPPTYLVWLQHYLPGMGESVQHLCCPRSPNCPV